MRKILIIFSFLSSIILSGCNGVNIKPGRDHFKEYTFVGTASVGQVAELNAGIGLTKYDLSKYIVKEENYSKSGANETSESIETTTKLYEDSRKPNCFIAETKRVSVNKTSSGGINLDIKNETNTKVWSNGNGYIFSLSTSSSNGEKQENFTGSPFDGNEETYKKTRIYNLFTDIYLTNTIYLNGDGSFTCIDSTERKNVSAVQWGDITKECVQITRNQRVTTINKHYQITENYLYQDSITNRDPSTGEWFSNECIVNSRYISYKYEYGNRENKSIDSLNASIKDKAIVKSINIDYVDTYYTKSDGKYTLSNSYDSKLKPTLVSQENNTYTFEFQTSINGNYMQSYSLVVDFYSPTEGDKTNKFKFDLDTEIVKNSLTQYVEVYVSSNESYLVNVHPSGHAMLVSFKIYFDGEKVIVTSISLGALY